MEGLLAGKECVEMGMGVECYWKSGVDCCGLALKLAQGSRNDLN